MSSTDQQLSLQIDHDNDRVRIALKGELDVSTAPHLLASIQDSLASGASELILDLHELDFIDSTGLSLLITTNERAQRDGLKFLLCRPGPQALKLLQVAGLTGYFTFE